MNILKKLFRLLSSTESNIQVNNSIENNKENFLVLFDKIEIILRKGEHYAQATIFENAKSYLLNRKYDEFQTKITSVNFWGGSGAVWEVYFENQELQKEFHNKMLKLIYLIQKTKISKSSINSLVILFKSKV